METRDKTAKKELSIALRISFSVVSVISGAVFLLLLMMLFQGRWFALFSVPFLFLGFVILCGLSALNYALLWLVQRPETRVEKRGPRHYRFGA